MKRRAAIALAVALSATGAVPQAKAATYAAEYTRALAYWYLPTEEPDVYRLYRVEVVRAENLLTGDVSVRASIVTDRCTEQWAGDQMMLACADGRRERVTRKAELSVSPDLDAGKATIHLGGRTHVVRFQGPARPERGFFEMLDTCSETDGAFVAGNFANMGRAHGRVLGQKLAGPHRADLDHSTLFRGYGAWCEGEG